MRKKKKKKYRVPDLELDLFAGDCHEACSEFDSTSKKTKKKKKTVAGLDEGQQTTCPIKMLGGGGGGGVKTRKGRGIHEEANLPRSFSLSFLLSFSPVVRSSLFLCAHCGCGVVYLKKRAENARCQLGSACCKNGVSTHNAISLCPFFLCLLYPMVRSWAGWKRLSVNWRRRHDYTRRKTKR